MEEDEVIDIDVDAKLRMLHLEEERDMLAERLLDAGAAEENDISLSCDACDDDVSHMRHNRVMHMMMMMMCPICALLQMLPCLKALSYWGLFCV